MNNEDLMNIINEIFEEVDDEVFEEVDNISLHPCYHILR